MCAIRTIAKSSRRPRPRRASRADRTSPPDSGSLPSLRSTSNGLPEAMPGRRPLPRARRAGPGARRSPLRPRRRSALEHRAGGLAFRRLTSERGESARPLGAGLAWRRMEELMTSPPQRITVECPACASQYGDWWRPSMNLDLEDFDDDYLEEASTATCPGCGHRVALGSLVVEDGVWRWSFGPRASGDNCRAGLSLLTARSTRDEPRWEARGVCRWPLMAQPHTRPPLRAGAVARALRFRPPFLAA
jgi:hypothetical protein